VRHWLRRWPAAGRWIRHLTGQATGAWKEAIVGWPKIQEARMSPLPAKRQQWRGAGSRLRWL